MTHNPAPSQPSPSYEHAHSQHPLSGASDFPVPTRHQTYVVFLLFVITDVLLSVDSGALPVALPQITTHFRLSRFGQGTVGALSPAGFSLATTSVGVLLTRKSPRRLLVLGLATTALSSAAFAAAPSPLVLLLSRAAYGVAYAVFFVFAPVWISMFAPDNRATSWISVIQAGAPIGAVVGLVIGGVVAGHDRSWRITFFLQAAMIAACTAAFAVVPSRFVDGDQLAAAGSGAGPINVDADANACAGTSANPNANPNAKTNTNTIPNASMSTSATSNPNASTSANTNTNAGANPDGHANANSNVNANAGVNSAPPALAGGSDPKASPLRYRRGTNPSSPKHSQDISASAAEIEGYGDVGTGEGGKKAAAYEADSGDHFVLPISTGMSSDNVGIGAEQVRGGQSRGDSFEPEEPLTPLRGGLFGRADPTRSASRVTKFTPREQLAQLLANKVFFYSSLALGFLTFTVEGIRYWVVLYRTEVFGDDISTVVASFTLVSSTAPILGMFFGGGVIDRAGGYRTKEGVARSLRILMFFSLLAGPSAAAILLNDIGTTSSLRFFAIYIWFLLFFGGAHVAPLTGIMIAVVPPEMRSLSSAVSLLVNHVIGYFLAPFGIGILANMRGIKLGFQTVISFAAIAISCCFMAWAMAERDLASSRIRKPRRMGGDDVEGGVALLSSQDMAQA